MITCYALEKKIRLEKMEEDLKFMDIERFNIVLKYISLESQASPKKCSCQDTQKKIFMFHYHFQC